jgi:hypothetical protein
MIDVSAFEKSGVTGLDRVAYNLMADVEANVLRNADAPWNKFSSHDYWRRNYSALQPEDREIIRRVSHFLVSARTGRPSVQRAIDVGAGTNLYPALLMLPWAKHILLADYSDSNVSWLHDQLIDKGEQWQWDAFWGEMRTAAGYREISAPDERLREACASEQLSVFDLPKAEWDLGTMFFVAESITEDPAEFEAAVAAFVGALTPGAPLAAAFMAGSDGYPVDGTNFPALSVEPDDIRRHLTALGVRGLNVDLLETEHRVRDGYAGMIVATGFASDQ